jgi:hypothetical protein
MPRLLGGHGGRGTMLHWLRGRLKAKPAPSARVPEIVDSVCRHVQDQLFALTGCRTAPVPSYSSMGDLLIGSYIWGLLEGYVRGIPDAAPATKEDTRATVLVAAAEVCLGVFGPERARWVRCQLPQWDGPPAHHPPFRWELSRMHLCGARDGRCLAARDPLCFAKAGGLLAFLLDLAGPRV